jgi:hypothetical protein
MTNDKHILTMEKDPLPPEGMFLAECLRMEVSGPFCRFHFRLLGMQNENPFVNGICDKKLSPSSTLYKWLQALIKVELEVQEQICLDDIMHEVQGAHCIVRIRHRKKEEAVFANVAWCYAHNDPTAIASLKSQ